MNPKPGDMIVDGEIETYRCLTPSTLSTATWGFHGYMHVTKGPAIIVSSSRDGRWPNPNQCVWYFVAPETVGWSWSLNPMTCQGPKDGSDSDIAYVTAKLK